LGPDPSKLDTSFLPSSLLAMTFRVKNQFPISM
jgi:hypothetical protein